MVIKKLRYFIGLDRKFVEDEEGIFLEFRDVVLDLQLPQKEDQYLLRWLRARDFDILKAEKMLKNHIEWRKKWNVDELKDDWKPLEVLNLYYPVGFLGEDKTGNPVWLIRHGYLDIRGALRSVSDKEFIRHTIWILEKSMRFMHRQTEKLGHDVTRQTIIFDLEHWKFRDLTYKPGMDIALELVKLYEANYPEILGKTFVINAPKFFQIAYSLIKPLLTENTLSKIQIFGSDKSTWSSAILEIVPADVLPKQLGGSAVDPDGDEYCKSKVQMGGEIPKSYYKENRPLSVPNALTTVVENGAVHIVEKEVRTAGSKLRWQFVTDGGDISFGVTLKSNPPQEVVLKERVKSHENVEEGEVICEQPGIYLVEFDNSFSYVRSKTLHFALTVNGN